MKTAGKAIRALMDDDSVSEIMIDGPHDIYVERGGKLEDTDICFEGDQQVIDWANGLLASNGWETVGEGRPWANGRLDTGDRVAVVIPPVAVTGPSVTIRKFPRVPLTLEKLIEFGSISLDLLAFFEVVMKARMSIIIAGGTSSGKTTLTNLLLGLAPPEERMIAVETIHEFQIQRERVIYLESEAARQSGGAEIEFRELLKLVTTMRPDRLVIGELRGPEVIEVFDLMNLGHEAIVAPIHATSPRDALTRIEMMATVAEPGLTLTDIRRKIAGGLDLIVQHNRLEDGRRKVVSIVEVQGLKGDSIVLEELFRWEKTGVAEDGRLLGKHVATGVVPSFAAALAADGLSFPEGLFEA